jgi:hypothetical protein
MARIAPVRLSGSISQSKGSILPPSFYQRRFENPSPSLCQSKPTPEPYVRAKRNRIVVCHWLKSLRRIIGNHKIGLQTLDIFLAFFRRITDLCINAIMIP